MLDINNRTRKELNDYKNSISLTEEQKEILIGGLLGDLSLRKIGNYSRLVIEQKNKEYLFHLYDIFKNFVRIAPKERLQQRLITSNINSTWYFSTISHPEFEKYYNIFYKNKIKLIPINLYQLLTPRSLAYWYMDDGSKQGNGFILATCCFSIEEHYLLENLFLEKFNIQINLWLNYKYFKIFIPTKNNANIKFKLLIEPYIINSMKYKL